MTKMLTDEVNKYLEAMKLEAWADLVVVNDDEEAAEVERVVADVVAKLGALGDAEHIALFLVENGIVGCPGLSMMCPVSNYIKRETELRIRVGPIRGEVIYRSEVRYGDDVARSVGDMPPSVTDFIEMFDMGEYPDLYDNSLLDGSDITWAEVTMGKWAEITMEKGI
jgi:hypothetical protein